MFHSKNFYFYLWPEEARIFKKVLSFTIAHLKKILERGFKVAYQQENITCYKNYLKLG